MRHIDADELLKKAEYLPLGFKSRGMRIGFHGVTVGAIENAPTVSPILPTRKQVKALPKCNYCEAEWGTCDPITNRFTMPPRGGIRFCPMCGRPLTDEAVDIVMQRLEALKDGTTD